MSWCSRAALMLTVGFVLACGGGGGDEAELERALLESRLREAEMRAELAEAKAEGGDGGTAAPVSKPKAGSTSSKGSSSSTTAPAKSPASSEEEPDYELDRLIMKAELKKERDREPRAAKEATDDATEDLLGDFADLDDDGSSGGFGSKLRDAVGSDVTVDGDARVVLISSKGERLQLPAKVPPGKYDIEATFSGRAPVVVGNTSVKVGSNTVISCNPRMFICRAQ